MSMGSGKSSNGQPLFTNDLGRGERMMSHPTQDQTNQFSQGITPASTAGGQPNTLAQFAPGAGASATNLMGQNFNQGGSLTTNAPPQQSSLSQASQNYQNIAFNPTSSSYALGGPNQPPIAPYRNPGLGNPYLQGSGQPPGAPPGSTQAPTPTGDPMTPPIDYSAALKAPGMIGISNGQPGSFTPLPRSEDARNNYFNSITGYKRNPDGSDRNADGTSYYDSYKAENPGKDVFSIMRDFDALSDEQQYGYLNSGGGYGFQLGGGTPQPTPAPQPTLPPPTQSPQLTPVTGFMPPPPAPLRPPQPTTPAPIAQPQPAPKPTYETLQRNLGLTRGGSTSYTAPKAQPPQIVNRNNNTIFGTNRPQQKPVAGPIAPPKQHFGRQTPTYRISAGKISK